ncbi:hypothetical protein TUM3794_22250 [Shewanella colwelliana]|uniref:RGS domain-containing protein n=1 Tax=Shewanella colwelliana TaxID=23 RepID=A0ABQ4P1J8_SHECO|nr:hypothetical protein TUM3794_22250 [Shewanella colwelliana]
MIESVLEKIASEMKINNPGLHAEFLLKQDSMNNRELFIWLQQKDAEGVFRSEMKLLLTDYYFMLR